MRPFARVLFVLVVAVIPPGSSFVAAQVEKAAAPVVEGKVEKKTVTKTEAKATAKTEEAKPETVTVEVKGGAANPEATLEPLIQQFLPQIRPIMRAEVHLIKSACSPSNDERETISREGERILKEAARKYAESYQGMMQGRGNGPLKPAIPRELIHAGMADVVKARLSAEQAARYKAEADARDADFKRVVIHGLVADLDQELLLSADQRAKINDSLSANWDKSWCQSLDMLAYGNQYFPNVPEKVVVPFLSPAQKSIWEKMPKNAGVFWGINNWFGDLAIEDEPAAEPTTAEPRKADAKP